MSRVAVLALGLLTAVAASLAAPLIGARVAELSGSGALDSIRRAEPVGSDAFRRVIASRESAAGWVSDPRHAKDVGDALFIGGQRVDARVDVVGILVSAKAYLETGLAGAPGDPQAFAEIAWAAVRTGDLLGASTALAASYEVGPIMPELALTRNAVGMGLWRWLTPELRSRLLAETHLALKVGGESFVRTLVTTGRLDDARAALSGREKDLAALDNLAAIITGRAVPSKPRAGT